MRSGFWPRIRDRTTENMEVFGWVLGHFGGVLGCKTKEAFTVTRLTVGVSNDLQMARNLTGGLPVLYRESLTPAHNRRQKGNAGGHRSVGLQNGQRGKCSDA